MTDDSEILRRNNLERLDFCLENAVGWGRAILQLLHDDPKSAAKNLKVRLIQNEQEEILGYYYSIPTPRIDHGLNNLVVNRTKDKIIACLKNN
jgi:hypothetical protein